jgi:peptidoglycan/xylan/chitin deacetylase (PgdA/CDA1 family)
MSHETATGFALPIPERGLPLSARLAAKASRFLARHTRSKVLTLGNAVPMVTFTFDDVPASACSSGAAILEHYDARGTFYIAGAGCGAASPGGRLATPAQLRALHANGHEIGCHTYSHPAVSDLGRAELAADLERNRCFLQGIDSGMAAHNFAYPYGDLSFRTKRYLETRFDSCRSLLRGVNEGVADLGALKTCPLEDATIDRAEILAFIASTVRSNGWLIFSSHDVGERPSKFGVTPDLLDFAVRASRDSGCRLATVADAIALARANKTIRGPNRRVS